MYSVFEALLYASLLGAALGLLYSLLAVVLLFLGDKKQRHPSRLPDAVELPLLKTVRIANKNGKFKARFFAVIRFLFDILFFFFCGMTLAVFVYSVGGIFRISYIVAVLLTAVLFCLTVGKLLLFFADYIRFCTIVTLLYVSLPFRLLFSFIFTAFSTLLLQFYKLYVIIYTKVYIIRSNGRHRNMERKWQGAVMQLVSE